MSHKWRSRDWSLYITIKPSIAIDHQHNESKNGLLVLALETEILLQEWWCRSVVALSV